MTSLNCLHTPSGYVILEETGRVNAPFTWFVNYQSDNPHTHEQDAAGLRLMHRFLSICKIDLASRALQGDCLSSTECSWLRNLTYLSLSDLERMSDKILIKRIAYTSRAAPRQSKIVVQNTAATRVKTIVRFLEYFRDHVLHDALRSPRDREMAAAAFSKSCTQLKNSVARTKSGQHSIRSLPIPLYLNIIKEVFVNPELFFRTSGGLVSETLMRDRAITLLALEGLRPGAIGNTSIADFRFRPGDAHGYMVIKDNTEKRGNAMTVGTPKAKGTRSTLVTYNSDITVKLWPFTCIALQQYIDSERVREISKVLRNRSRSLLFVKAKGEPIGHRATFSAVFSRLAKQLKMQGMMKVAKNDPFSTDLTYKLSAYTLRHCAASFFYAENRHLDNVEDLMRSRFGWTEKSDMPSLYAARARSEGASIDMNAFFQSLLEAQSAKR